MAPSFVSRCRRNKLQVSVASRRELVSHRLLMQIAYKPGLIKGSKELEITGPILQTGPVIGYGVRTWSLWTILSTEPTSRSVISSSVETQQTPGSQTTWSRCRCEEGYHILPTVGWYRLLLVAIAALVPWFKYVYSNREYVKSGVYHVLPMCCTYIKFRINFLASECLSLYLLKVLCIIGLIKSRSK
jgi:hypothetical protein